MDLMEQYKKEMIEKKIWAVIGVTDDESKFGYKIWKRLKQKGYTVYGINPKYTEINGEKIYKNLFELPEKPEVVNIVVNPKISNIQLDSIKKLDIKYVWFQPGTIDEIVLEKAEKLEFKFIYFECIYAELE